MRVANERGLFSFAVGALVWATASGAPAAGTTYEVGPGKAFPDLQAVAGQLNPGDVVEVYGDATYGGDVVLTRAGAPANRIVIRGVPVNGEAPLLSGGHNTIEFRANHYVFEGFEVTGGTARCVYHHAHDITIRDTVVRDCPGQGILGADTDSGSLTLDRVEVYRCGEGLYRHQIYMATDERAYPGSVFRMQFSYIHSGNGGHNVKSRAERNEIYFNWIEGAYYHELELIGPAPVGGLGEGEAREDSDVVGNVLRRTGPNAGFRAIRIGGDGTGQTWGRYRFVNNTIITESSTSPVFFHHFGIESVEMHNNLLFRAGGGPVTVFDSEGQWSTGSPIMAGSNNWVPSASTAIPSAWTETRTGSDPGLLDLAMLELRPAAGSPLIDAGNGAPQGPDDHPFPSPLEPASHHPPRQDTTPPEPRPVVGTIDIGAYEFGSSDPPPEPPSEGCLRASQSGDAWHSTPIDAQTGTFTAAWDVTPAAAGVDGSVALSEGAQSAWTGLAAIVRFNPDNLIDVRDGSSYAASAPLTYSPGTTYLVRMVVDVPARSYSVTVKPDGGNEVELARDYVFRTEQQSVTRLDHWTVNTITPASLEACPVAGAPADSDDALPEDPMDGDPGGCRAGGSGSTGGAVLLALAVLYLARSDRRRSPHNARRRALAHRLASLLSVWLVCSCGRINYEVAADTDAAADAGPGDQDLSSWKYRKTITIEASRVTADLDGFPLLVVRASDSDLAERAEETGQDILFTRAGSTTRLSHEIESFDPGSGALVAWVRVDRLSATADTQLHMYYGNSAASSQEDPEGLWAEYAGVWHLNDDPGVSPEIRDATANRNHGTATGLDASSRLAGPIGGALHFEGGDDVIDLSDPVNGTLDPGTSSFSVSLWVRVTASGDCLFAFRKSADEDVTPGYDIRLGVNSWEARCFDGSGVDGIRDPNFGLESEFLGSWTWLVGVVDREAEVIQAYTDSVSRQGSDIVTIGSLSNDEPATIGSSCLGDLDEVRVASFAPSPDWIATEFANQSDPTGFVKFGAEEAL